MPDQHRIGSKRGNFFARCCTVDWCETNEWSTNWSATPQDVQKKNEKKVENATARSNSWNQNEDFIAKAQQFYKLQSWVKGREARAEKEISTFSQFMLREKMQSEAWNKLLEKWCNFQSQQSHQKERGFHSDATEPQLLDLVIKIQFYFDLNARAFVSLRNFHSKFEIKVQRWTKNGKQTRKTQKLKSIAKNFNQSALFFSRAFWLTAHNFVTASSENFQNSWN